MAQAPQKSTFDDWANYVDFGDAPPAQDNVVTGANAGPGALLEHAVGVDNVPYTIDEMGFVNWKGDDGTQQSSGIYEMPDPARYEAEYRAKYGKEPPLAASINAEPPTAEDPRNSVAGRADTAVRAGANTVSLGIADYLEALRLSLANGTTVADEIRKQHAQDRADFHNRPLESIGGSLAGAFALPGAGAEAGLGRNIALGAGYGGVRGALDADTPEQALYGGLTEAGLGGGLGGLGKLTGEGIAARAQRRADIMDRREAFSGAAERQGVDFLPADIPNAYGSQVGSSITNSTLGTIPLTEAADRAVGTLAAARNQVAGQMGVVRDAAGTGQAVQRGVRAFLTKADERLGKLYERIPIEEGSPAELGNTRAALSDLNRGFTSNRALSALWSDDPRLQATLNALADGAEQGLSWQDLKAFRTIIGQKIGQPSLTSDGTDIARLRQLYGALSEDMRVTAANQGSDALRAFERANTYARAKEARTEQVFKSVLGNDYQASAESALRNLMTWSNSTGGNFSSVARLFRSLPEDEANSVRASIFATLGRASKGRQDETGAVFSPAEFMTQWNGLTDRAKRVLFGGEQKQNIDDIVQLAAGMKGSARFANTSRTGLGVGGISSVGTFMSNPVLGSLYIAGQFGAGKLLGSPKFARWLIKLGNKPNVQAVRDQVRRLPSLAQAEPALANEYLGLQQRLMEAIKGGSAAPARADQPVNESAGVQGQQQQQNQQAPKDDPYANAIDFGGNP